MLHDAVKPRLRLFLGVDLVGSTTYKQSPQEAGGVGAEAAWLEPHLAFYTTFELLLQQRWRQLHAHLRGTTDPPFDQPVFWKANGDELLYTVEIEHDEQPDLYLRLWIQTLRDYREKVRDRAPNIPPLDVRSNAWVANFPSPNTEVIFRREVATGDHPFIDDPALRQYHLRKVWYGDPASSQMEPRGTLTRDFIGPAIDTGFRISSWSTPRRLAVSVELALILAKTHYPEVHDTNFPMLSIRVSGTDSLKGVMGGRPYPIAWIDVGSSKSDSSEEKLWKAEDNLLNHSDATKYIEEYLTAFLAHHRNFLSAPIIQHTRHLMFKITPERIDHLYSLQAELEDKIGDLERRKTSENLDIVTR